MAAARHKEINDRATVVATTTFVVETVRGTEGVLVLSVDKFRYSLAGCLEFCRIEYNDLMSVPAQQ